MKTQATKRGESRNGRRTVQLSSSLEKSLSAYAGAAVAAGVSLLALTRSAEGKIVYTPAHTNIPINNKAPFLLDLNHDGIADFSFWNVGYNFSEGEFFRRMQVGCVAAGLSRSQSVCRYKQNEIWGKGSFAFALRPGFKVGANKSYFRQGRKFRGSYGWRPATSMASYGGMSPSGFSQNWTAGQWLYTKERCLGLQFVIDGQVHYGWARVAVTLGQQGVVATLTGYAYETIPNKPIITGKTKGPDVVTLEPATLGRLARAHPASRPGGKINSGPCFKSSAHSRYFF